MAVYVDPARHPFRRMMMCHMVADTREELLEMAARIGVDHRWIQKAGTPHEHFDICKSKRAAAVRHGAIEVGALELGRILRAKRQGLAAGNPQELSLPGL